MRNKPAQPTAPPLDEDEPIAVAVPVDPNEANVSHSAAPVATLCSTDADARAAAAAARERGTAIIRGHLDEHLSQNPNSSYVTWIATLHPENATVTVDPRFLIPGNPWLTVFKEAQQDLQKGGQADVTAEDDPSNGMDFNGSDGTEQGVGTKTKPFSGFMDAVFGAALALTAICSAFAIEICSAWCYLSFWLCANIVSKCAPVTVVTALPFLVAWLLMHAFHILDAMMLFTSIIVVETIAAMSFLMCTIFACSLEVGKGAHQTTRRLAHLTRWAFRHHFESWTPARTTLKCFGLGSTDAIHDIDN